MIQHLESAARLVARARAEAQYVIATFHGGAEGDEAIWHANEAETYLGENRGNAVAFARAAIDAGADVVVGHGPHVLRSIECYKGKPLFHSLGNFVGVGGLSIRGMASLSAIAGVQLGSRGELLGIEFLPVTFTERKVPVPDERQFSAHLVNWLGREARYSGQFLRLSRLREPVRDPHGRRLAPGRRAREPTRRRCALRSASARADAFHQRQSARQRHCARQPAGLRTAREDHRHRGRALLSEALRPHRRHLHPGLLAPRGREREGDRRPDIDVWNGFRSSKWLMEWFSWLGYTSNYADASEIWFWEVK